MNQANLFEYLQKNPKERIFLVDNLKEAKRAKAVFDYLDKKALILPDIRIFRGDDTRSYLGELSELFLTLKEFYNSKSFLIAPFRTLTLPFPKSRYLKSFNLEFGELLDLKELKERLLYWGYSFVDIVGAKGEVSIRGDIIDIFPPNLNRPIRISLFDSEIEEIRFFDISTQKRDKEEIESVEIAPAFLALSKEEFDELSKRVEESEYNVLVKDIGSLGLWHLDNFATNILKEYPYVLTSKALIGLIREFDEKLDIEDRVIDEAKEYKEIEVKDINRVIEANRDKKITIVAKNETLVRASALAYLEKLNFKYIEGNLNLKSPKELILSINKEEPIRKVKKSSLVLDEIGVGEYVVHQNHGVGIFRGIEKREVLGKFRDFVKIEYQNEDKLYIPVENLHLIDRYIAPSGALPTLDKLGKGSFSKLKEKVRKKLFAIAKELIELNAKRLLKEGIKIKIDKEAQERFLKEAGFTHTIDQKRAIDNILEHLSSGKVMDMLLSADVGFGKTEVAMNAMFAVVKSGFQAALIAPTTLLSMQHFKTLQQRFKDWGIRVAKLDRFSTPKEKKEILRGLEEGEIDIVVGTHGVINAKFKNLGLVVIDEEHKFGVKQKEALKALTINTHLLSMSATPIPRTLNMALSQIKSFAEILTPPQNRAGVRTFVKDFDIKAVGEAIRRELRRGGQVFYIYNSIAGLEDKKKELLEEIPDLKITMLHSKVGAAKSEKEMVKFENKEYDLLLSTSIVESGLHLPNANTIIVDGAQNFGIADLHQLRGRVGRGGVEGYCYFFVDDKDNLSQSAKKRLLALESNSELGSGAILAMHDLEIRGGGNLVGEAQSGHIKQIGYSLYLKMLEEEIRELTGKRDEMGEVELKLNVDAYLSEELIREDRLRLELYRRLSQAKEVDEVYEIEEEIVDRFGSLDKLSRQFIDLMIVKILANKKGVKKISNYNENIYIEFRDGKRVTLKAKTKDSDDIIKESLEFLKEKELIKC